MPRSSSQKKSGAGSSGKKKPAQQEPDALEMLKGDHETVLSLFQRHASAASEEQVRLTKELFHNLTLHTALEEELFYPALRGRNDAEESGDLESDDSEEFDSSEDMDSETDALEEDIDQEEEEDLVTLAYEDHQNVKDLLEELKRLDPESDQYRDRFGELKDALTDHMEEEEEVLFAEARLRVDTKALGAQMAKRRRDLDSSMAA